MKLDKIRFARLIAFVQQIMPKRDCLSAEDISDIDALIDVEVPKPSDLAYPSVNDINRLVFLMHGGNLKIEAIQLHRKLTGWGLKESKEYIDKYWVSKPDASYTTPRAVGSPADETLGDILTKRLQQY